MSHTTPSDGRRGARGDGLALYCWLLLGGVRLIASVHRGDRAGLALGASFLALFVHALSYGGFLEDPLTWLVLGIAAAFASGMREPAAAERFARRRAGEASDGRPAAPAPAPAGGAAGR